MQILHQIQEHVAHKKRLRETKSLMGNQLSPPRKLAKEEARIRRLAKNQLNRSQE